MSPRRRKRSTFLDKVSYIILTPLLAFVLILGLPGLGTVIAAACVVVAIGLGVVSSFIETRLRRQWGTVGSLYALSPKQFERHVGETYRLLGYDIQYTPDVGDQGVDVIARRGEERVAIQCKRYADKASNSAVQAVHAGRVHHDCNHSILVCLGGFSPAARSLSNSTRTELIDGPGYADLMQRVAPVSRRIAPPRGRLLLYALALLVLAVGTLFLDMWRGVPSSAHHLTVHHTTRGRK